MNITEAKQKIYEMKTAEIKNYFSKLNISKFLGRNEKESDTNFDSKAELKNSLLPLPIRKISELISNPDIVEKPLKKSENDVTSKPETSRKIINKFFDRISVYLDSVEEFLKTFKTQQLRSIVQKKLLFESEKSDQTQRTYRAKRVAKDNAEYEKEQEDEEVNLKDNPDLAIKLSSLLGLGVVGAAASQASAAVPVDVPYQAESGQLKQKGKTTVGEISGYPITSGYGWRWGKNHGGVDVGVPIGTMFAVKANSKVVYAGYEDPKDPRKGYGLLVDVWVDQIGQMLRFAHLSSVAVKVGDTLPAGTILGRSGSSGRSTGPHFHIEAHDTITGGYGSKDPTPHLGYVILGDEIQQKAEGSIERVGRIMVGEAGKELVVPLSQMSLFSHAMLEEKIKSLMPMYQVAEGFNDGLKSYSGTAETSFASGGVAGTPEFWQLVAISSREDTLHPQGQADVAQSIYNRAAVGSYPGGKNIKRIITAPGQYQPTFTNPGSWNAITDRKSAIAAAGKGSSLVDKAARSITNPSLQKEAMRFIGGRTDFQGESQKPYMKPGDITRGKDHNFFGWFYDARLAKAAPIPASVKSMTNMTPPPEIPKTTHKKELNILEKFMLWISPPKSERASLTSIDEVTQREIAYETQSRFDMSEMSNEIIYMYQPTYYYPEEVA